MAPALAYHSPPIALQSANDLVVSQARYLAHSANSRTSVPGSVTQSSSMGSK